MWGDKGFGEFFWALQLLHFEIYTVVEAPMCLHGNLDCMYKAVLDDTVGAVAQVMEALRGFYSLACQCDCFIVSNDSGTRHRCSGQFE